MKTVNELIMEMTLEEKLAMLSGGSIFRSAQLEKYGIPSALLMDGGTGFNTMQMGMELAQRAARSVHGEPPVGCADPEILEKDAASVRYYFYHGDIESLDSQEKSVIETLEAYKSCSMPDYDTVGCYPPGMLLGATWNPGVVYECASALGKEAAARGVDVLLGSPNVNLHRDPRCGRLFEGYSEDPFLVSSLAPEFVKGIQAAGVLANVKHFAANNQETWRMGVDEHISERVLRELYLPGFEACIREGNCRTVMTAYNKINGVACSQNTFLLKTVLRGEWDFQGMVMSDWNGVYDWAMAIKAGNDLAMPGPMSIDGLNRALDSGELSMAQIDECVLHILNCLLDMPVLRGHRDSAIDVQESMAAAYDAAVEGITLLKNRNEGAGSGILPLGVEKKVSFYGEHSKNLICCGEGSAEVVTNRNTNVYDCTKALLGEQLVDFEMVSEDTQAIIVVVSATGQEGMDRENLSLPEAARDDLQRAMEAGRRIHKPVICVLNVVGPVELMDYVDELDAIICAYLPGMGGGQALADILFGRVNPSGKLPLTFPRFLRDCPAYGNFPGEYGQVNYGEGLYVGYRYYDKRVLEPLYPFGFGLSYTTFDIESVEMPDSVNLEAESAVQVYIQIKNTGHCFGKEVIQIYVEDVQCRLERPVKELKGFTKVALEPGEVKTVKISLHKKAFSFYDTRLGAWVVEPGIFVIHVGTSSRDIVVSQDIRIQCRNPYTIGAESTISQLALREDVLNMFAEEIPELDVERDLKSVIIFNPDCSFSQFWKETVVKLLPEQGDDVCRRYRQVCEKFDEINNSV